jgi:hypothetical protein
MDVRMPRLDGVAAAGRARRRRGAAGDVLTTFDLDEYAKIASCIRSWTSSFARSRPRQVDGRLGDMEGGRTTPGWSRRGGEPRE